MVEDESNQAKCGDSLEAKQVGADAMVRRDAERHQRPFVGEDRRQQQARDRNPRKDVEDNEDAQHDERDRQRGGLV